MKAKEHRWETNASLGTGPDIPHVSAAGNDLIQGQEFFVFFYHSLPKQSLIYRKLLFITSSITPSQTSLRYPPTMSNQNSSSPPPPAPSQSSSSIPTSIPTLRPKNQKPNFARPATSDLKSRLQTFLPQMAAANAELEKLAQEGGLEGKRLEDVGEGDEYVEMELGLGVMEEKKEGDDSSDETSDESSDDSSEDSSEEDDDDDEKEQKKKQKEKEQKEKDILGRLMGHKQGREKAAGIQEVE